MLAAGPEKPTSPPVTRNNNLPRNSTPAPRNGAQPAGTTTIQNAVPGSYGGAQMQQLSGGGGMSGRDLLGLIQQQSAPQQNALAQQEANLNMLRPYLTGAPGGGGGGSAAAAADAQEALGIQNQRFDLDAAALGRQLGLTQQQLGHIGHLWDLSRQGYESQDRTFDSNRGLTNQLAGLDQGDMQRDASFNIDSLMRQLGFNTGQVNRDTDFQIGDLNRTTDRDLADVQLGLDRGTFEQNFGAKQQLRGLLSDATGRGAVFSRGYGEATGEVNENLAAQLGFLNRGADTQRGFLNQNRDAKGNYLNQGRNAQLDFMNQDAAANRTNIEQGLASNMTRSQAQLAYDLGLIDENQLQSHLRRDSEHNQAIQQIDRANVGIEDINGQISDIDLQRQLAAIQARGAGRGGGGGGSTNPAGLFQYLNGMAGIQQQRGQMGMDQTNQFIQWGSALGLSPQQIMQGMAGPSQDAAAQAGDQYTQSLLGY